MQSKDFKLKQALADKLGQEFERDFRRERTPGIIQEIRGSKTGALRELASREAETDYEISKDLIEKKYTERIKTVEE